VNPVIFGSRKAQSLRTLKGAATLKIQYNTAFTKHLLCYYTALFILCQSLDFSGFEAPLDFMGEKINILKGRISKKGAGETEISEILSALR